MESELIPDLIDTTEIEQSEPDNRLELTINLAKKITSDYSEIDNGLASAVDRYKAANPQKYISAQMQGDFIMKSEYDLTEGVDKEGQEIELKLLLQLYNSGFTEFTPEEKELLVKYI